MLKSLAAGLVMFGQLAVGAATQARADDSPGASAANPAEATVSFRNDVGAKFKLVEARFSMDGVALPKVVTEAKPGKDVTIFTGPVAPGKHVVTSHLSYQGRNRAIFTYLDGYTLNVNSDQVLNVAEGNPSTVTVVAKDHKGFNVPFEKSVAVGVEKSGTVTGAAGVEKEPAADREKDPRKDAVK